TSVGSIGIPYLVGNEEFYFKDGNLTWFKNFSKEIDSKFLYYWMSSEMKLNKYQLPFSINMFIGAAAINSF
ncbi:MAG: hypothetical protein LBH43_07515, partial [Treponema sp.]|nr:hypothetical protein [Treponema sp.]